MSEEEGDVVVEKHTKIYSAVGQIQMKSEKRRK